MEDEPKIVELLRDYIQTDDGHVRRRRRPYMLTEEDYSRGTEYDELD